MKTTFLVIALLLAAGVTILLVRRPQLQAAIIAGPTPTPVAYAFDRTLVTREITLPEEIWYAIQTGVFSSKEAAVEKAAAYTDRGAPGTVVEDHGKWRVFIASYGREEDAAAVRQRLGETQRVETYLYSWKCGELRLRLKGMAGQLDVAEAGLSLLMQGAVRLRDTAILLDAAQLTREEAMGVVTDMNGQITLWLKTARERFGREIPPLVQDILNMTNGWSARYRTLKEAADSATALSAALKGQGMEMYRDMITLRTSLYAE